MPDLKSRLDILSSVWSPEEERGLTRGILFLAIVTGVTALVMLVHYGQLLLTLKWH